MATVKKDPNRHRVFEWLIEGLIHEGEYHKAASLLHETLKEKSLKRLVQYDRN